MDRFDDFLSGYEQGKLEEVKRVQTVGTDFSDLMKKYEEKLKNPEIQNYAHYHVQIITEVLTPDEINHFLQATQQYADHKDYSWKTGYMFSSLIQNSYDQGYNDFRLNTTLLPGIDLMGSYIVGKRKDPVLVTVQGNLGFVCADEARHSVFIVNGTVEKHFGLEAQSCTFKTSIWSNIEEMKWSIPKRKDNVLIYLDDGKEMIIP